MKSENKTVRQKTEIWIFVSLAAKAVPIRTGERLAIQVFGLDARRKAAAD